MKSILDKLKTEIPSLLTYLKSVYIVTDPAYLPKTAQFPCVGLKDGDSSFSEGTNQTENEKSSVLIYAYQKILRDDEASIMGDGSQKGVLEMIEDLRAALNWNDLDGLVESAYIGDVSASENVSDIMENVMVQRKGCLLTYQKR